MAEWTKTLDNEWAIQATTQVVHAASSSSPWPETIKEFSAIHQISKRTVVWGQNGYKRTEPII
eukprot:3966558-Amphidinium_carterae.1